jgi:hypothetical protein
MNLKLVPLRIPSGWYVTLNDFTESYPERFIDDDYEHRWEFKEDILQLRSKSRKKLIDLGWYPEFQVGGQYKLLLVDTSEENDEESFYWNVIFEFESRSIEEIKTKIEELLK